MRITRMGLAGKLRDFIVEQKCIPWRVSNRIEVWRENSLRQRLPFLYSLIRFGRIRNIVRQVTHGPNHHFFGYYDKCPWNASGGFLLAHEISFNHRPPEENDSATIGVVKLDQGCRFEPLAQTYAWNWQQGSMLQWHPKDPEHLILYNDRHENRFIGVAHDLQTGKIRIYERPFYAVTPNGRFALSLNIARLQTHRPGYGYAGVADPWSNLKYPHDDGIYLMFLETGKSDLILSLQQLAETKPTRAMRDAYQWINHIQVSPDGNRFAFFHLWRVGENNWGVRLYTSNLDGSGLRCLLSNDFISHYDWMDEKRILVWAKMPRVGGRFVLCDDQAGTVQVIGEGILTEDGHCSFSPDRKWILNDTYPDRYDLRTLMLFRTEKHKRIDLARLYSPKAKWWGEIRCDLHPRWSRDGRQACIDSVHDGTRQMYVIDLSEII